MVAVMIELLAPLLALLAVCLTCLFLPKCHRLTALRRRKIQLDSENRATDARMAALREQERALERQLAPAA